jgi:hypothetical protein
MATNNAVNNIVAIYELYANVSATINNVTGDGTSVNPVVFDTIVHSFGDASYNNATGIFTASTPGVYRFDAAIALGGLNATNTDTQLDLIVSTGENISGALQSSVGSYVAGTGIEGVQVCGDVKLAKGDTAQISVVVGGINKVVDILAGSFMSIFYVG